MTTKDYEKILTKAKVKYSDAIRGRDYQEELLKDKTPAEADFFFIEFRKRMFISEIALLEDVFSPAVLQAPLISTDFLES